jgi:hypothetical protein
MTRLKAATMALAIPFVAAWNQTQAFGQCCGDCDGDGQATVDEIVTVVNRALSGCVDDEVCGAGTGRLPATGQTTYHGLPGVCWGGRKEPLVCRVPCSVEIGTDSTYEVRVDAPGYYPAVVEVTDAMTFHTALFFGNQQQTRLVIPFVEKAPSAKTRTTP